METTETTLTRNIPGQPPRVYNLERSVVTVEGRELPDSESRLALDDTVSAIRKVIKTDPTAVFDIEGHTGTEGTGEMNLDLSARRARRIYE